MEGSDYTSLTIDLFEEAFKEYAKILLDKTSYPRIASHDDELINWTQEYGRVCRQRV